MTTRRERLTSAYLMLGDVHLALGALEQAGHAGYAPSAADAYAAQVNAHRALTVALDELGGHLEEWRDSEPNRPLCPVRDSHAAYADGAEDVPCEVCGARPRRPIYGGPGASGVQLDGRVVADRLEALAQKRLVADAILRTAPDAVHVSQPLIPPRRPGWIVRARGAVVDAAAAAVIFPVGVLWYWLNGPPLTRRDKAVMWAIGGVLAVALGVTFPYVVLR